MDTKKSIAKYLFLKGFTRFKNKFTCGNVVITLKDNSLASYPFKCWDSCISKGKISVSPKDAVIGFTQHIFKQSYVHPLRQRKYSDANCRQVLKGDAYGWLIVKQLRYP